MPNITFNQYLEQFGSELRGRGYEVSLNTEDRLGPSDYALTAKRGEDLFQLRVDRGPKGLVGNYKLQVSTNNQGLLDEISGINSNLHWGEGTSRFNLEKRQFHDRLDNALQTLNHNYSDLSKNPEYRAASRAGTSYMEKAGVLDWVRPTIGLELDDGAIHPVFGVSVGGNHLGGLLLYDPIDGQLETGAYVGFGNVGVGGITELGTPGEVLGLSDPEPQVGGLEETIIDSDPGPWSSAPDSVVGGSDDGSIFEEVGEFIGSIFN